MNKIGLYSIKLTVFSIVLLVFIGIQTWCVLTSGSTPYEWSNYTVMQWVSQILYWMAVIGVGGFLANAVE